MEVSHSGFFSSFKIVLFALKQCVEVAFFICQGDGNTHVH